MGTESPHRHASLPTELWYPIIDMLPSLDQKTCLSVSKTFHDITAIYVFSHVTISLGFWRPFEYEAEDEDFSPEEKTAIKRHANASYDILRHIMRTPDFAKGVKKVSVRAFSNAGEEMQIAIRKSCFFVFRIVDWKCRTSLHLTSVGRLSGRRIGSSARSPCFRMAWLLPLDVYRNSGGPRQLCQ